MRVIRTLREIRDVSNLAKTNGKKIGFVPTMGCLHAGHLSLVNAAKNETDIVIVSIFVNPIQFGPNEDFDNYPRDEAGDFIKLEECGCDIVFCPGKEVLYDKNTSTYVKVEGEITSKLCGLSRPGHFNGVATVVLKLFNIIKPDISYFGQKDFQQVVVVKKMVKDFFLSIEIKMMPTIRCEDGLAMSSRNLYLNPTEREEASSIYRALIEAKNIIENGEKNIEKVKSVIKKHLDNLEIEYIDIVDPETLEGVDIVRKKILLLVAVKIGKTRLIDNMLVNNE